MKRLLKHRVVTKHPSNSNLWSRIKPDGKIFMNVPRDLLRYLVSVVNANSTSDPYYGHTIYLGNYGKTIIVPDTVSDLTMFDIESTSVASNYFRQADMVKKGGIEGTRFVVNKYNEAKRYERGTVQNNKRQYIDSIRTSQEMNQRFEHALNQMDELDKYNIIDGVFTVTFENVVAEDTEAVGEDIELGKLVFSVDIYRNDVQLIDGTYPRGNDYNSSAFHPHQLSSSICLGTQDSDMHEAIANYEFSIVEALLYKFAHSYTSSDSAGASWTHWAEGYEEVEMVWVEHMGEDYPIDDCVHSSFYGEYILLSSAVYLEYRDDSVLLEDTVESTIQGRRLLEEDAVYCNLISDYIHADDAIELQNNRGWVPDTYEEMVEVGDYFYHLEDVVVPIGHDDYMLKRNCVRSKALNDYIYAGEAMYDSTTDDYYTADTFPKPVEETKPEASSTDEESVF